MKHLLFVLFVSLFSVSHAQDLGNAYDLSFSQEFENGYTSEIIYVDDDYLYVLFSEHMTGQYARPTLRIDKIDKRTYGRRASIELESTLERMDFSALEMVSETDKSFYLIFSTGKRKERSLAAIKLDHDLKLKGEQSSIITVNEKETRWDVKTNSTTGIIVFLTQDKLKKGDNSVINYKMFDDELQELKTGSFNAVLSKDEEGKNKTVATLYGFKLMNNSNLVSLVTPFRDEVNEDESSVLNERTIMNFNPMSNEITTKGLRVGGDRALLKVNSFLKDGKYVIAGFYGDNVKKGKILKYSTQEIQGVFLTEYDGKLENKTKEFLTPFTVEMKNRLKDDRVDKRRDLKGKEKKQKKGEDESDGLSTDYDLKRLIFDDKDMVFIMEQYRNWSTTTTYTNSNGVTTTRTTYHAVRGSTFTLNVSSQDGKLNWYDSFKKYSSFSSSSSSIYDIEVIFPILKNNELNLFYKTGYKFIPNEKAESADYKSAKMPYYTRKVNWRDGSVREYQPQIREEKLKPHQRINLSNYYIDPSDGNIYSINSTYKMKPLRVALITVGFISIVGSYPTYIAAVMTSSKSRNEVYTYGKLTIPD